MHALFYSIVVGVALAMIFQSMLTLRSYRSRSVWEHRLAAPMLFPVWAIIFSAIVLALIPTSAFPSEACPTLAEARKQWPNVHLRYRLRNGQQCWGNFPERVIEPDEAPQAKRPAHVRYSVNRNPLKLGKPAVDASGNRTYHSRKPLVTTVSENDFNELDQQADKGPSVFYPELIPGNPPPVAMLTPRAMTGWPVIVEIDVQQVFTPWAFRIAGAFER